MKKYQLIIVQFVMVIFTIFVTTENSNSKSLICLRPPKMHVIIDFGRPESCKGFRGICSIQPVLGRVIVPEYPKAGANCTYEDGVLIIEVIENEMTEQLFGDFSSTKYLEISNTVYIAPELLMELSAPTDSYIPIGNYLIKKIEDGFELSISLK